jgi:CspA family cold shock protein
MQGTVIWFNEAKGYGFLKAQDGKEIFCHYSAIQAKGYKKLAKDQQVEFSVIEGRNGKPQADNVVVVA